MRVFLPGCFRNSIQAKATRVPNRRRLEAYGCQIDKNFKESNDNAVKKSLALCNQDVGQSVDNVVIIRSTS